MKICTLSLHDALPIYSRPRLPNEQRLPKCRCLGADQRGADCCAQYVGPPAINRWGPTSWVEHISQIVLSVVIRLRAMLAHNKGPHPLSWGPLPCCWAASGNYSDVSLSRVYAFCLRVMSSCPMPSASLRWHQRF